MESDSVDQSLQTRQSLLGRLKDWEDSASWQDFFHTYWKLIYSVAIKAGLDDAAAQDVVQETVFGVAKQIRDFKYDRRQGSFKSWLLTITRRRVIDHWRRKYAEPWAAGDMDDATTGTPLLHRIPDERWPWENVWDEEWDRNFMTLALERVKDKVKPRQYQLFDCLVLKEWPLTEVKKKLNASAAQIYFAKYKITSLLQRELRQIHRRWQQSGGELN